MAMTGIESRSARKNWSKKKKSKRERSTKEAMDIEGHPSSAAAAAATSDINIPSTQTIMKTNRADIAPSKEVMDIEEQCELDISDAPVAAVVEAASMKTDPV